MTILTIFQEGKCLQHNAHFGQPFYFFHKKYTTKKISKKCKKSSSIIFEYYFLFKFWKYAGSKHPICWRKMQKNDKKSGKMRFKNFFTVKEEYYQKSKSLRGKKNTEKKQGKPCKETQILPK